MSEQSNNPIDALIGLIKSQLLDVNTSIPGVIVSYEDGLAHVRPVGKKRFADGDVLDYPIIPNVRINWPSFSGGAAGVKGPVKAGDSCLLVFAQQAVDGSDDRRMFDLQDAYAVMCDLGKTGAGDSSNNNDMTMFFGSAYIRLTAAGKLEIKAPGGTSIDTTALGITATTSTDITTPATSMSGTVTAQGATTINGSLVFSAGMVGSGGAAIAGGMSADGLPFGTHKHGGVQTGTGISGTPVP